jgi:hypothetical protein
MVASSEAADSSRDQAKRKACLLFTLSFTVICLFDLQRRPTSLSGGGNRFQNTKRSRYAGIQPCCQAGHD